MRSGLGVVVLCLVATVLPGTGLAVAAFTAHHSNPQDFSAAATLPAFQLEAQSRTNDHGASSSEIQFGLRIRNTGTAAIDLRKVTMRYWFSADDRVDEAIPACYYATLGCGRLHLDVVELTERRDRADAYLAVGFTPGSLNAGASAQLDQLAVRDPTGGKYVQTNDFSFLPQTSFANNPQVTLYVDGALVWGTEPAKVAPVSDKVEVDYANLDQSPDDKAIKFTLQARNTGTGPIDLPRLTMRYFFTKEAGSSSMVGACDYAQIDCSKVTIKFGTVSPAKQGANTYAEIGFTSGSLSVNARTGPIQIRLHKSDYSPFDERDDFSWGTQTTLAPWDRVPAYLDGRLVWGVEP